MEDIFYENDINIHADMETLPFFTSGNDSGVLEELGIKNTFQLFGKVLTFKKGRDEQTHKELYDDVCLYFKDIKKCKVFVFCIFIKLDTIMPGFCDLDFQR